MRKLVAWSLLVAPGCYQSFGAGYVHRFADRGGHGFEGSWMLAGGEVIGDDEPAGYGRVSVATGPWGLRLGSALGVMVQEEMGDASFFLRPGLALLVIGAESRDAEELVPWVGIGAELDVGFLVPLGDATALEIGARAGGDVGYGGVGTGTFAGAFIAIGFAQDGWDLVSH